jgi:hypothetical protein
VDSGFGNSIYWTLPVVTTIIHFTTLQHINQTCLLCPVSLQTSYSVCLPVSLFCVSISLPLCVSKVKVSHIATDGQSISKSWCRIPSGALDQIFISL